jgi:hypothetical protein
VLEIMQDCRARMEAMTEWMEAVDTLHAQHSARVSQLREEQAAQQDRWDMEREKLHKTQAQLEWLESRLPIRLYQQLKARLQKSLTGDKPASP